jgi:chaperonin cofactor prefoldin
MLISNLQERLEKLQAMIDGGQAPHDQKQALTLNFYEERIEALENRVEALKSVQVELVHQQHLGPPK